MSAKPNGRPPRREQGRVLSFPSVDGWRRWLAEHWAQEKGEWLLIAKTATPRGMHYQEALEEALCWGWVDSQLQPRDAQYYTLWFCPRRPRSMWSAANRATALRLVREGRMQASGLDRIREAKASGRWQSAYASAAPLRLPADVRRTLEASGCLQAFHGLSPSRRLQLVHWVNEAKRPETRARRIAGLSRMLESTP